MAAYKWKTGSHNSKVSAQIVGETCEKLEAEKRLNAQTLVDISRPKDSPTHSLFEWDNRKAAEEWRRHQARNIINSIEVVVEEKEPIRAFFNIEKKSSEYLSIATICREPGNYQSLLKQATAELKAFRMKYSRITELNEIFALIDNISTAS